MSSESLKSLNSEHLKKIDGIVNDIRDPLQLNGLLNPSVVVEGGKGQGTLLEQVIQNLFPLALYIGTDLAREVVGNQPSINGTNIESLLASGLAEGRTDTTTNLNLIKADCFDVDLLCQIRTLLNNTNSHVILISLNALFALFDHKANPWTSKDSSAIHSMATVLKNPSYRAHLHLASTDLWDKEWRDKAVAPSFFRLESTAKEEGWKTVRISGELVDGLLLVQP